MYSLLSKSNKATIKYTENTEPLLALLKGMLVLHSNTFSH